MVLGVCRRVAGDRHLADDAFQAAFVVSPAGPATSARPRPSAPGSMGSPFAPPGRPAPCPLADWLREVPMPAVPDRADESIHERDADALAILDEEIAELPEHLRVAVVLCELDGVSRKDAAKRLGVAEGTLSSRLAKARSSWPSGCGSGASLSRRRGWRSWHRPRFPLGWPRKPPRSSHPPRHSPPQWPPSRTECCEPCTSRN